MHKRRSGSLVIAAESQGEPVQERERQSAGGAAQNLAQGEAEGGTLGRTFISIQSRLSAGDTKPCRPYGAPELNYPLPRTPLRSVLG